MEDATITQDPLVKERFPSVVDTDDLVFELGKQVVKAINYEKLLNSMIKKTQAFNSVTSDVAKEKAVTEAKQAELQRSNALYQENNRKLDAALVQARNEKSVLEKVILEKDKLISELNEKLVKYNTNKTRRKRRPANT